MKFVFINLIICVYAAQVSSIPSDGNSLNDDERKFRSGKVHQLWLKAERMELPSVTMADLYLELKQHDHELMELKAMKAQGEDGDGLVEAKLQKEFNGIMFKFGLTSSKSEDLKRDNKAYVKNKEPFQDRKLNWLWKEAQLNNRFSEEELNKLFLEFKHHEDKLVELQALQADVKDVESNSIEIDKEDRSIKETYSKMEELIEEVNDNYKRIHILTKKGKDSSLPYSEPRVLDLWYMMKNGNFTEEERNSLEEELRHFQHRIEKHRHFKEELRNVAEKVDFHGGKHQAPRNHLSKHQKLQDKVQDLANKVHKTFTSLKNRLSVGVFKHNEL